MSYAFGVRQYVAIAAGHSLYAYAQARDTYVILYAGLKFGPYDIQSPVGEGGLGEVWKARDTEHGREVALRILPTPPAGEPNRFARFERDVRVLTKLKHPNIAVVYGLVDFDRVRAVAFEWVTGTSLADRIAHGPLPIDEALAVAAQIADALTEAHEHAVIHGDVKPSNIKLVRDGAVKVLDFGLLEVYEPEGSASQPALLPTATARLLGTITGTAAYMSPEVVCGAHIDQAADVWGFGCVVYEMLTARQAFSGEDLSEMLASIVEGSPEWTLLPAATPRAIDRLLRSCLDKDRGARLRNLAEASATIRSAVSEGDSVQALLRRSALHTMAGPLRSPAHRTDLPQATLDRDEDETRLATRTAVERAIEERYRHVLDKLTPWERELIRQRIHEDPYDEIAQRMAFPTVTAARMAVMRALRHLRDLTRLK